MTTYKKGKKVIIVQYTNAIYGIMVASLLYCNKFVKTMKIIGFQINPYYPCVSNRLVNNKQQTICFRVDDCKLGHQDSEVNDGFINTLCDEYESAF